MARSMILTLYKLARPILVGAVGATVVFLGIAMIVLPGPALLVIPIGLAILGLEFAWARRWLHTLKTQAHRVIDQGTNGSTDQKP